MKLDNRATLEAELARKLGRFNREQYKALLPALGNPPRLENLPVGYFDRMSEALQGVLQPVMEQIYTQQAAALMGISSVKALAIAWELVNERAAQWARQYAGVLVKSITDNTRSAIRQQVEGFYRDQRSLDDLTASLSRLFSPIRAELIAVTEVTRAGVQGELGFAEELRKMGLKTTFVWQTANDEIADNCPICGPRHEKKQGDGWNDPPPAHPRCRCWLNTVVDRAN